MPQAEDRDGFTGQDPGQQIGEIPRSEFGVLLQLSLPFGERDVPLGQTDEDRAEQVGDLLGQQVGWIVGKIALCGQLPGGPLAPALCQRCFAIRKAQAGDQGPVDLPKIVKRDLPRVEVDHAGGKVLCQGPVLDVGEAVRLALAVRAADAQVRRFSRVYFAEPALDGLAQPRFVCGQQAHGHWVEESLAQPLDRTPEMEVGLSIEKRLKGDTRHHESHLGWSCSIFSCSISCWVSTICSVMSVSSSGASPCSAMSR